MNFSSLLQKSPARVVDCIIMNPKVRNDLANDREKPFYKRSPQKLPELSKKTPSYIETIEKRIELINKSMSRYGLPYHYSTRNNENGLLLDMVVLDTKRSVTRKYTKKVTEENYRSILDEMLNGSGFIFDD